MAKMRVVQVSSPKGPFEMVERQIPEPDPGSVRIRVQDNGIGIPREYHERLFRIFERLNPAETYPGTGVGLAIVKKAVEQMKGRLGLESEPGRGSTFWIELPPGN